MLKLGQVLAWFLIVVGAVRALLGFYVAYYFVDPIAYKAASARYLGSATSGQVIDKGLAWIAAGIIVWFLAAIVQKATHRDRA